MSDEVLLGGILICQLVIIGGLLYALKLLNALTEHAGDIAKSLRSRPDDKAAR